MLLTCSFSRWRNRGMEMLGDLLQSVAQLIKNPSIMQETPIRSLGSEDPQEEGTATHSSILAWRIPMDRGAWQATVHGVSKSERLSIAQRTAAGGFPGVTGGKEPTCQCRRHKRCRFNPLVRKIPWRRKWQPTPVFFHGQRILAGYGP